MKKVMCLALLFPVLGSFGCENGLFGIPNPRTIVRFDPASRDFYISNTKDVDVTVEGLEADLTQKSVKLAKLTLRDNASDVRSASVQQMLVLVEQQKQVTEQINQLGQIITSIAPWAAQIAGLSTLGKTGTSITTPWGGATSGLTAAQVAAIQAILATPTPTTTTVTTTNPAGGG